MRLGQLADCVAVLILVVLPLRMLWRVKLPRRQRRMILSIFASSVFLAFGALFHTVGQILDIFTVMIAGINVEVRRLFRPPDPLIMNLLRSHYKVALSFFVCNLLVIVTYTYRFWLRDRLGDGDDTTTDLPSSYDDDFTTRVTRPAQTTSLPLTTVDLDIPLDHQTTQMTENVRTWHSHGRVV